MVNRVVTECECHDPHHTMMFTLDDWEEDCELYVSVQLNVRLPLWRRLWVSLLYILGRRSRFSYGHWDEGSISVESARELKTFLEEYIALSEKQRGEKVEWQRLDSKGGKGSDDTKHMETLKPP